MASERYPRPDRPMPSGETHTLRSMSRRGSSRLDLEFWPLSAESGALTVDITDDHGGAGVLLSYEQVCDLHTLLAEFIDVVPDPATEESD